MIDVVNSPVPGPPDDAELLIARIAAGDREAFSRFYDACHVLNADTEVQRASRLALCGLARAVLAKGLWLLGIDVPEKM